MLYEYNIARHFYISGTETEIYLYLNSSDARVVLYEYNISRHFYISGTEIEVYLYINLSDVLYFTNTTALDISIYLVLKLKYTYTLTHLSCCTLRIQHL